MMVCLLLGIETTTKDCLAPESAFAALKSNGSFSKPGAYVQAATESTESFQKGGGNKDPGPVKTRVGGRSQRWTLPVTQSLSGYQDTPVASYPRRKDADRIKDGGHDELKRDLSQTSTNAACGHGKSVAGMKSQYEW
jgi:hypothetical protein